MIYHVLLVGDSQGEHNLREFGDGIVAQWPHIDTDQVEMTYATTINDAFSSIAEFEPCVVAMLVDNPKPSAEMHTLVEFLAERSIPAIVLAANQSHFRERFFDDDIIVGAFGEPAGTTAVRLHALSCRQRTVRQMRSDLNTARRCQGGLHGEITRIEEELQLAARIQREFLPKTMPEVGNIRLDVFFRPAGYVSGDIYNVARLDEHHIAFFLADAVGHGVPAALMTMVIAHSLDMKSVENNSYQIIPPRQVLTALNESILHHHTENGRFATGVYGIINTETNEITLASAGHPPPLLICEDGSCREIKCEGGLLGVFPDEVYEESTFTIERGERLFIYSDGFEMAFPDDSETRKIRDGGRRLPTTRYLEEFTRACTSSESPTEVVKAIAAAVDSQPGSLHQIDDLTGICLHRLAVDCVTDRQDEDGADHAPSLAA